MNGSLRRRHLLASLGTGVVSALAGCSALSDESAPDPANPYRIGNVHLQNLDPEPHQLDLLIRRDDEVVHWDTHEVRAFDEERRGGTVYTTLVEAAEFGGCTSGIYSLSARLENGTRQTFPSITDPTFDGHPRTIEIAEGATEFSGWLADVKNPTCTGKTTLDN